MISSEIVKEFNDIKTVSIFTHINTDGDAIGSAFCFYEYFKGLGKEVNVYCDSDLPEMLEFLNVKELINKNNNYKTDLSIAVDCNDSARIGRFEKDFYNAKKTIQFDHHPGNPSFAKYNLVNSNMSSTCELLYTFFTDNNLEITKEMARFLLVGILTDTGGLRFSCTSNCTLKIVAEIVDKYDLKIYEFMSNIFETQSHKNFIALSYAYNNAKFYEDNKIVLITIPYEFYKENGIQPNQIINLTKIATELKDTVVSAVISEEKKNVCKVSFRSHKGYDVRNCAMVFGGGGHKAASGCKIFGNIESTAEKVLKSMMDGIE